MNIRFASCNILFDDGKSEPRWQQRLGHLSELIRQQSPDIFATQEGRKEQLLQLAESISSDYELVDAHREWDDVKMYPCLFIKKGIISCESSFDRWLSETPEVKHSKSFASKWPKLACIANLKKSDKYFTVASFHFDNVTATARPLQAEVLIEQSELIAKGNPIIFMGDANDNPESKTLRTFREKNYYDPWNWQDLPHTFHGFKNVEYDARIDYIIHTPTVRCIAKFCDTRSVDYYSDHFMIHADIEL